jgi:hypothetical protein
MSDSEKQTKEQLLELFKNLTYDNLSEKAQTNNALVDKFGPEVIETVEEEKGKRVRKAWANFANKQESKTLDLFISTVWEPNLDLFDCTVTKKSENEVQMKVTRCIFAEIAKELGIEKWGFRLYCKDDPHMVAGYNPKMEYKREKTLMEGDDCCDH